MRERHAADHAVLTTDLLVVILVCWRVSRASPDSAVLQEPPQQRLGQTRVRVPLAVGLDTALSMVLTVALVARFW